MFNKKKEEDGCKYKDICIAKGTDILSIAASLDSDLYKSEAFNADNFPSRLQIGKALVHINKLTKEVTINYSPSTGNAYINDIRLGQSLDQAYVMTLKDVIINLVRKDVKCGEYSKYQCLTFTSENKVKQALVREVDESSFTEAVAESLEAFSFIIVASNGKRYLIIKVKPLDRGWAYADYEVMCSGQLSDDLADGTLELDYDDEYEDDYEFKEDTLF